MAKMGEEKKTTKPHNTCATKDLELSKIAGWNAE